MNKLLLCVALLAMSYIASADVPQYALPLLNFGLIQTAEDYLSQTCTTSDGKLYYADMDNISTPLFQIWDSSSDSSSTINVTLEAGQVAALIASVNATADVQTSVALKCIGTDAYVVVAFNNISNAGIHMFTVQANAIVPNYSIPLNYTTLADSQESLLTLTCGSTDGKFYFEDRDAAGNAIMQVWDASSQALEKPINLTAFKAQIKTFLVAVSASSSTDPVAQCIGTNVYVTVGYKNATYSGVELFLAQSDTPAPSYDISLTTAPTSAEDWMTQSCQTADGKLYFGDATGIKNITVQQWDPSTQTVSTTAVDDDFLTQFASFLQDLGATAQEQVLLSCIGNDAYMNVAYTNSTNTGVELFLLKKSAGILSFSFTALFVAIVALML